MLSFAGSALSNAPMLSSATVSVRDELGFDAVVDHRSKDFRSDLDHACPNGIDVSFENVGGQVSDAVMPLLSLIARVPV